MTKLIRTIEGRDLARLLDREWLVTNGLGGFASGTLSGAATRRYHGLLVAAHPAPLGRLMMLNHLTEIFRFPDYSVAKVGGVEKTSGDLDIHGANVLSEFRLEQGLPVWRFDLDGHTIEKRIFMPYKHNTVHVIYTLVCGEGPVRLKLRPSVHFRDYDAPVSVARHEGYTLVAKEHRYEVIAEGLPVHLRVKIDGHQSALTIDGHAEPDVLYRVEGHRGYESVGTLYSPGVFRVYLTKDRPVLLSASTEPWDKFLAIPGLEALEAENRRQSHLINIAAPELRSGFGAELVLAADQFIIMPMRVADQVRAESTGEEARSVIAGYHWFTDWGRDTMISLEGLTLATGRPHEAKYILRTFAAHVKNGLIPNYFPDGENQGVYHTADATLWFFHALSRYLAYVPDDRDTLRKLLPTLKDIVAHHERGTDFGIGVDPKDGLLRQGAEGYQLTWMDAKVGDWVVTPRRGKAVEINALWYNALMNLASWLREEDDADATSIANLAGRVWQSFNDRFWNAKTGCLWDVLDGPGGDDDAVRPNQVFAISLPHPVLAKDRWKPVLDVVERELVTPVGLRSLSRQHPDYKKLYDGDLKTRDAAYHQGTVWGWLIGPFIDAWRKLNPDGDSRQWLGGFEKHLSEAGVGSISEVFDAEPPYTPRACIAQAWSVAEVARCWAAH